MRINWNCWHDHKPGLQLKLNSHLPGLSSSWGMCFFFTAQTRRLPETDVERQLSWKVSIFWWSFKFHRLKTLRAEGFEACGHESREWSVRHQRNFCGASLQTINFWAYTKLCSGLDCSFNQAFIGYEKVVKSFKTKLQFYCSHVQCGEEGENKCSANNV